MTFRTVYTPALGALALAMATGCHQGPSAAAAPIEASTAQPALSRNLPDGVTAEMVAAGERVFHGQSCIKCHGSGAHGTQRAPDLTDSTWIHIDGSYPAIVSLVTTGFAKSEMRDPKYPFAMNPRGGVNLTTEQIRQVAAYVWSLSHK